MTTCSRPGPDVAALGPGHALREGSGMGRRTMPAPPNGGRPPFEDQPFYNETVRLLQSIRDRDFDTLAALCDDDFGIIDVGSERPIRTRGEWERWFTTMFASLDGMGAETSAVILDYQGLRQGALGFGVLEFRQILRAGRHVATADCVATIIWKLTPTGWREARWHASVISSQAPAALRLAA